MAVGLKNSAAHVEIIVTPNGPKMVELGACLGGDWITSYLIQGSVGAVSYTHLIQRHHVGNGGERTADGCANHHYPAGLRLDCFPKVAQLTVLGAHGH